MDIKISKTLALNLVLIVLIVVGLANVVRITGFAVQAHPSGEETAMLFVMSFCPYGIQAENAMIPVVDLLGSKASIAPHYIVTVQNGKVNSLHGTAEANEDMRQACVWKYYGQEKAWNYISAVNSKCSLSTIDTCWKTAASAAGIDTGKIENCFSTEGITLMQAEQALAEKYSVQGSPTLIINGKQSNAARTADGYKAGICSVLSPQPSECNTVLSSTGSTAPSGGCGS